MSDDYGASHEVCPPPDFVIDPDSTDFFDFPLALDLDGDTIETVLFVLPDGLTEEDASNTDTSARIYVSGAECGRTYRITCRYTTTGGSTRDKTIRVVGRSQ